MKFDLETVPARRLAARLEERDAEGWTLLYCIPGQASPAQIGEDASFVCVFGEKEPLVRLVLFTDGSKQVRIDPADVVALDAGSVAATRTKVYLSTGDSFTVDGTITEVASKLAQDTE